MSISRKNLNGSAHQCSGRPVSITNCWTYTFNRMVITLSRATFFLKNINRYISLDSKKSLVKKGSDNYWSIGVHPLNLVYQKILLSALKIIRLNTLHHRKFQLYWNGILDSVIYVYNQINLLFFIVCVKYVDIHRFRCVKFNFAHSNDTSVLYSYHKRKYWSRDRATLGPTAPILVRVDHSMR